DVNATSLGVLLHTKLFVFPAGIEPCPWQSGGAVQSEIDLNCELQYTRLILLRWIHNPKISAPGIGIGPAEARMIECVEGFAAHLYFQIFAQPEILVDSNIQYVHAARSNIRPTGGIAPHIVSEVCIDSVSRIIGAGWFVIGSGEILHTRPSGVEREVIIRIREFHEVRCVEPA